MSRRSADWTGSARCGKLVSRQEDEAVEEWLGLEHSGNKGQAILTLRCKSDFCSFLSTGSVTAVGTGCSPVCFVAGGRDIRSSLGVTLGARSPLLCGVSGMDDDVDVIKNRSSSFGGDPIYASNQIR